MELNLDLKAGLDVQEDDALTKFIKESGVYSLVPNMAYFMLEEKGSTTLNIAFTVKGTKFPLRVTYYITNEAGKHIATNKAGEEYYVAGFSKATSMVYMLTGKTLPEVLANCEEKVVDIYDYNARANVATTVKSPVDLYSAGAKVKVGLLHVKDNVKKQVDGKWIPTAKISEKNVFDKVFHAETNQTYTEILAKTDSVVMGKWLTKYNEKLQDKSIVVTPEDIAKTTAPSTQQELF